MLVLILLTIVRLPSIPFKNTTYAHPRPHPPCFLQDRAKAEKAMALQVAEAFAAAAAKRKAAERLEEEEL